MSQYAISLFLIMFACASQAEGLNIQVQQDARERCAQEFEAQCMKACQKTNDVNCSQACSENARNQCRDAGE